MRLLIILLVATCFLLPRCVTAPLTTPKGPGGVIVDVDESGVTFNQAGRDLWLSENVPASWFEPVPPNGYHLSNLHWHLGNEIRINFKNGIKQ